MPGEVWRLKWDPFKHTFLLSACMYSGVHVLEFSSSFEGSIVGSYYQHKNISYGVDWSYMKSECSSDIDKYEYIIGSCSFYDKLLCISKFSYKKDDATYLECFIFQEN